jgi:magnesium transporter
MVWQKRYSAPGAMPGTLTPHPDPDFKAQITAIHYSATHYTETPITDLAAYLQTAPSDGVLWLNIDGLGDVQAVETLGRHFGLHPLVLEDALNVPQRAKVEDHETYVFLISHTVLSSISELPEQVSMFLGATYVLTVQEGHVGDVFEPVRQRLRQGLGRIRHSGADHLAYALLDASIDSFFPFLDTLAERLEAIEDDVLNASTRQTLAAIYALRRSLSALRHTLWPHREMIGAFARCQSALMTEQTRFFLRDCSDHVLQIMDMLENYREIALGLLETHLSLQSHQLNEVMKMLTIISTIFIPLTFVVGIYGMNFDPASSPWNMPELQWRWGYPASLGLMAAMAIGLLIFFRRKGWL